MEVITFNGKRSSDYGLRITQYPTDTIPEKDVEAVHVPGLTGDVLIDKNSWKNITRSYEVSLSSPESTPQELYHRLIEWLYPSDGYSELIESWTPGVYRIASLNTEITDEIIYNKAVKITIEFNCKPQKYLINTNQVYSAEIQNGGALVPNFEISHFLVGPKGKYLYFAGPHIPRKGIVSYQSASDANTYGGATGYDHILGEVDVNSNPDAQVKRVEGSSDGSMFVVDDGDTLYFIYLDPSNKEEAPKGLIGKKVINDFSGMPYHSSAIDSFVLLESPNPYQYKLLISNKNRERVEVYAIQKHVSPLKYDEPIYEGDLQTSLPGTGYFYPAYSGRLKSSPDHTYCALIDDLSVAFFICAYEGTTNFMDRPCMHQTNFYEGDEELVYNGVPQFSITDIVLSPLTGWDYNQTFYDCHPCAFLLLAPTRGSGQRPCVMEYNLELGTSFKDNRIFLSNAFQLYRIRSITASAVDDKGAENRAFISILIDIEPGSLAYGWRVLMYDYKVGYAGLLPYSEYASGNIEVPNEYIELRAGTASIERAGSIDHRVYIAGSKITTDSSAFVMAFNPYDILTAGTIELEPVDVYFGWTKKNHAMDNIPIGKMVLINPTSFSAYPKLHIITDGSCDIRFRPQDQTIERDYVIRIDMTDVPTGKKLNFILNLETGNAVLPDILLSDAFDEDPNSCISFLDEKVPELYSGINIVEYDTNEADLNLTIEIDDPRWWTL